MEKNKLEAEKEIKKLTEDLSAKNTANDALNAEVKALEKERKKMLSDMENAVRMKKKADRKEQLAVMKLKEIEGKTNKERLDFIIENGVDLLKGWDEEFIDDLSIKASKNTNYLRSLSWKQQKQLIRIHRKVEENDSRMQ